MVCESFLESQDHCNLDSCGRLQPRDGLSILPADLKTDPTDIEAGGLGCTSILPGTVQCISSLKIN